MFASLGLALGLAIVFVYMVLASQFGSFIQPFALMLALPLSIIGAVLGLLIANKLFDMVAFIGLIMLMGLVTKNSILLIDYLLRRRFCPADLRLDLRNVVLGAGLGSARRGHGILPYEYRAAAR